MFTVEFLSPLPCPTCRQPGGRCWAPWSWLEAVRRMDGSGRGEFQERYEFPSLEMATWHAWLAAGAHCGSARVKDARGAIVYRIEELREEDGR